MRSALIIAAFCSVTAAAGYMAYRYFINEPTCEQCPVPTAIVPNQSNKDFEKQCTNSCQTNDNSTLNAANSFPESDSGFAPARRQFVPESAYGPPIDVSSLDRKILRQGNPILLQAITDALDIESFKTPPNLAPTMAYADGETQSVRWMPRASSNAISKHTVMPYARVQSKNLPGADSVQNKTNNLLLKQQLKQFLLPDAGTPAPFQNKVENSKQSSLSDANDEAIKQSKWAFHYFVF